MCNRLKNILPQLVHVNQFAFVKGRKIDDLLLTLQDIIDFVNKECKSVLMFAADFEKAFDSIEHNFIISVLKHFNFGENFICWIKLLLMNNVSCIMNNGKVTNFFPLEKGTKQGDPISPYIFILVIEILATMVRKSNSIQGFKTKYNEIKLLLFADDTTFYLQSENCFKEVLRILGCFTDYSSLKINVKKSEAGWLTKGKTEEAVKQAGIKYVNFDKEGMKILGIYFTHNKHLDYTNNLEKVLVNFQTVLSIWKSRNLTLYGKIQVLRSLALPKLYYVCSKMYVNKEFLQIIESTMKDFIWNGKKPKIKHTTLIGDYLQGGLRLPDFTLQLKAKQIGMVLNWIEKAMVLKSNIGIPFMFFRKIRRRRTNSDKFKQQKNTRINVTFL